MHEGILTIENISPKSQTHLELLQIISQQKENSPANPVEESG